MDIRRKDLRLYDVCYIRKGGKTTAKKTKKTPGVVDVEVLRQKGKPVTKRQYGKTQARVLEFLKANKTKSFTQRAVAEAIGIQEPHARQTLFSLMEKKHLVDALEMENENGRLVRYWYVTPLGLKTTL